MSKDPNAANMTPQEFEFRQTLEKEGLFTRNKAGDLVAKPNMFLLAMSHSPASSGATRAEIFKQAYVRLLPNIKPELKPLIDKAWQQLNPAEQEFLKTMLTATGHYNVEHPEAVQTIVSMYSALTPSKSAGLASIFTYATQRCASKPLLFAKNPECLAFFSHKMRRDAFTLFQKLHKLFKPIVDKMMPKID